MVSYYNSLTMYPKNPCTNLYPAPNHWYAPNYHQPPNAQLFGPDSDAQAQPMYYTHHAMFHQGSPDWPSHDNFSTPQNSLLHQSASSGASSGTPGLHLSHGASGGMGQGSAEHISTDGLTSIPSPPITVSGSEMSSPGAPNGAGSPHTVSRPAPVKSPYEWMKKTSYQNQTNPGKTRTKDKYRVVYTDFQRLELEKEYHTSKYITIRRKTELAQTLSLSERQVKIWFQNRRAKERKQTKKHESNPSVGQNHSSGLGIMETKPKIEPLHLQHPALHQMSAMSMSMGPMSLHAHSLHHSHFGMTPPPPSTPGQHLHGPQVSQPAASAGALI